MIINGKCHCGNIAFTLDWPDESSEIPARACGCSFCVKHGGVWTSNPKARLTVIVRNAALVSPYTFGTQTATFHVCAKCGAALVVPEEGEQTEAFAIAELGDSLDTLGDLGLKGAVLVVRSGGGRSGETFAVTLAGLGIGVAMLPSTLSAIGRLAGGLPTRPGPLVAAIAIVFVCTATASAYGPARRASRESSR